MCLTRQGQFYQLLKHVMTWNKRPIFFFSKLLIFTFKTLKTPVGSFKPGLMLLKSACHEAKDVAMRKGCGA